MAYLILTIVFLVGALVFFLVCAECQVEFVLFFCFIFLGAAIYCGYNSYESIKNPIYVEKEEENSEIPLIDTKKNNNGKYDKAYIDKEKLILYVDSKVYNRGKVTIVEEDTVPKIIVKKYVPKMEYNSINFYFNRKVEYIIYIPKEYEVNTSFKF